MGKLVLLFFSFFAASSVAAPYLDLQVQSFISQGGFGTLPVLITFRDQGAVSGTVNRRSVMTSLIRTAQQNVDRLKSEMKGAGALKIEPLWILNGAFTHLSAAQLSELMKNDNIKGVYWSARPIRLLKRVHPQADRTRDYTYGLKKVAVPEVRERYPHLLGTGIRVGILDTGLATQHPDLRGKLKVFKNFSPAKETTPRDDFGHGTHVAGTIAGGSASGQAIGVAPEVQLIVGRIFDGSGNSDRAQILRAMQWMADPDENPATDDYAQVVNSSWSDDDPFDTRDPEDEPFCQILQNWLRMNMIPVFSAGNTGPAVGTINLPAGCPQAFAVGATEHNDRSPHFSSTGPAVWRNLRLNKPEVSAPGFHVKSADRYGGYEEMSGTSMSAPHVTGAFAILLQANPRASAEEIKNAMTQGAKELGDPGQDAVFGYGRIDILNSLQILERKRK